MNHLGLDSKGRVYKGVGESAKAGEWSYRASGQSKDGPMSIEPKDVTLAPDEDRYEIQEFILDGKSSPLRYKCGSGRSRTVKSRQHLGRPRSQFSEFTVTVGSALQGAPRCPEFLDSAKPYARGAHAHGRNLGLGHRAHLMRPYGRDDRSPNP
jgi:hypothetical protein